ncbi:MAG TPA: glycosyltransferase family 4 protein [Bryobacteraceae bacterium]|nr:glycosyltransferase family 4 protein [Bryobacteraceae bacterium]
MPSAVSDRSIPRHVFMTVDTVGGVWTYALELCKAFSRLRIHVSLVTLGRPADAAQRAALRRLRNAEFYEAPFPLEWMEGAANDFERSSAWLLSLAQRLQPDLIHLNGYWHAALDWEAPVVVVAHSCLLSWWAAVRKSDPLPARFAPYRDRVTDGLRRAHVVVAPSRAMLSEIERLYTPLECGLVVPNARTAQLFPAGKKENLVLATGRLWDEAKNLALLDRFARRLPWPLYLAGDDVHPDGSRAEFRNVVNLGYVPAVQLAPWFSRAAIYAAPARYEPFGLSVLEAALAGCALVLSDISSLRENWSGAALFAPAGDGAAFESAIRQLIEDSARRRKLSAAAAARALHFSPSAMANGYLSAYHAASQRFAAAAPGAEERLVQCV